MRDGTNFKRISAAVWAVIFLWLNGACSHTGLSAKQAEASSVTEYANAIVTNYIEIKDVLINDNWLQAAKETEELLTYLQAIEDSYIKPEIRQQWLDYKLELINILEQHQLSGGVDLESQRQMLSVLTSKLEGLIDEFGPVNQTLYKQYCPKALNGQGAYWLNEKKEILNPYGGSDQLHCGKIVEVIEGRGD